MPEETTTPAPAANQPVTLEDLSIEAGEALAQSVASDFKRWKEARRRLEETWRECWEAYLCDKKSLYTTPEVDTADRSHIVRPLLYEAVEAIHSNLLNTIFPASEKFFSVLGKTEADHENAGIIEEFLQAKLINVNFFEKYAQFIKQGIVIGNTVAAVPWKRKIKRRRVRKPVTLFGVTVGREKQWVDEIVYDGPDFEVIDMFDFLIDPDEPDFEQAKVIRKVERHLMTLKRNPAYGNLDDLATAGAEEDDGNKDAKRNAFGINTATLDSAEDKRDIVTLYEAWGDFWVGDTFCENYVCVVANGERVIRFEPNPYDSGAKPFIFTTFIPVPNEVYGIGAIEKCLGLQHAVNTLTNQKLDVINISINNPFTYLINDDVFDPDMAVTRPGALIPVKSHDTLRPIQYLSNYTVAFSEIADLKSEIQEATGALKFFTGGDGHDETSRTATEVSALVSGGSQKFSQFIAHLENTSLEPFLRMTFENAKQFLSEPEVLRVIHPDGAVAFIEILPEVIQRCRCAFKVEGSTGGLRKEQEMAAMVAFVDMTLRDPELRSRIDVMALYRKIYRRLGFKDEDVIFGNGRVERPEA